LKLATNRKLSLHCKEFEFLTEYNNILSASSLIGKSSHRRTLLKSDIEYVISDLRSFLDYGFPENDSDIIEANNIYSKLLDIKNRL
jgi:hypothetical protein